MCVRNSCWEGLVRFVERVCVIFVGGSLCVTPHPKNHRRISFTRGALERFECDSLFFPSVILYVSARQKKITQTRAFTDHANSPPHRNHMNTRPQE